VTELKEELLEGDRPAREIQEAIDTLNSRIAQSQRESAEYSVKARVLDIGTEDLMAAWEDYLPARSRACTGP
jgi:site-specific DNA recombinase